MEENLGIIDIEIYFPKYYISQYELEEYDKVPHGKYTIGLGQTNMSFVDDNEDINSMCLTVLDKLIKKNFPYRSWYRDFNRQIQISKDSFNGFI